MTTAKPTDERAWMTDSDGKEATPEELCEGALRHYDELSNKSCSWMNTIPKAIRFWYLERPKLLASLAQPAEGAALPEPKELADLVRYLRDNDCPTQNGDAGKMALWDARQRAAGAIETLDATVAILRAELAELKSAAGWQKAIVDAKLVEAREQAERRAEALDEICAQRFEEIAQLQQRAEAMREDAERYRWLRDVPQGAKSKDGSGPLVVVDSPSKIPRYVGPLAGKFLDAALDAARKGGSHE